MGSSADSFERACRVLVGGVNSPVRAFRGVGGTPRFVARAAGSRVWDVDGREYIDLVGGWGPAIVGHAHPVVVEAVARAARDGLTFGAPTRAETMLAERIIGAIPSIERVRFTCSGTEAGMAAVRLARGFTGRAKVIKFAGCYHGHTDALLVAAGSGASTLGVPDSAGVSEQVASGTLVARYNDAGSVEQLMRAHRGEVAAVLVEPVAGNMGMVLPAAGFLERLRELCDADGALLVFDEVMTGFRVAWGGWQDVCGVRPDLTMLAKVIGGGLPVGALGGRAEVMEKLAPMGPVYQAGTLAGNPLGMAAGLATLELCGVGGFYDRLGAMSARLMEGIGGGGSGGRDAHPTQVRGGRDARATWIQACSRGGMAGMFFGAAPVRDYAGARAADHEMYGRFFHAMLARGVWLPPSGYESWFVSSAHSERDIDVVVAAARESIAEVSG